MTSNLGQRVQQNWEWMKSPRFRRGLLGLIPLFYLITVAVRVVEGVRFPDAMWDLGVHGFTLVIFSCFNILLTLAHRRWSHRL
ncbi:hypothetical protein [Ilumatobacter sp.]|uniref:hypothetical protein n=1 Tax=Ilumatobacter sp. TaxID=1967498 RepID=UPI0037519240